MCLSLLQEHSEIDAAERRQLATQANVIVETMTRQLVSVSAAIDAIGRDMIRSQGQRNAVPLLNGRIDDLTDVLFDVSTLLVMNANGDTIASNQRDLIGKSFNDGKQFLSIRNGGDPEKLYVSPPFRTPLGAYAISGGKVVMDEHGRFVGVILAILDPGFFKTLMKSVRYSDDMRASVIHGDGKMTYSTEDTIDVSKVDLSTTANSIFNQHVKSGQESNIFSGISAATNDERVIAIRSVGPAPISMSKLLIITISRSPPAIHAQWRQQALIKAGLFGLVAMFGTVGMIFYQRRQRAFVRVSADKEAERILSESVAKNARFVRSITDAVPELIAYFDTNMRCQFANKGYQNRHQKPVEAIIGMTIKELMGAALFAVNESHIRAVLAGERQQFERFFTLPDGSVAHVLANYIPDFDESGTIIGYIAVLADIKAFKIAEAELRLAAEIFKYAVEAIMVTDDDGIILSVNPAFTAITGYSPEEAVGETQRVLRSHRHDQEFHDQAWQKIRATGQWSGEIWNRRKNGEIFLGWKTITRISGARDDDVRYLTVFHDITASWENNETIRQLAFHDALTKLPNRMLLMERLDHHIVMAEREPRNLALMFLDLDRFKAVNDTLGHAIGDDLLIEVAQKLQALVRKADTVARLGGDEFVILLENPANKTEVEHIAHRIISVINEPFELQGKMAHVGTSVGIAMYPADGASATDLIKSADTAMYEAKKSGRNTFRFFDHQDQI